MHPLYALNYIKISTVTSKCDTGLKVVADEHSRGCLEWDKLW